MRVLAVVSTVALFTSTVHAESGDRFDAGTTALQFGGGVLGGAVGGAALGGAFYGLAEITNENDNSWAPIMAGALGIVVGGFAGALVSVKLVGDARDAEGGWGGTSLGLLGGALVAGAFQQIVDREPTKLTIGVGVALLVAGPVVGYQLQNDGPSGATTERRVMIALPVAAF